MGSQWKFLSSDWKTYEVPHMLGYCLRLNDDQKLVQIVPGVQGGFSIILNAFVDDYMPNIVSYNCSFIKCFSDFAPLSKLIRLKRTGNARF